MMGLGREIWIILDERERIDAIDEQEGQKVQDMVRRQEAEVHVSGVILLRSHETHVVTCSCSTGAMLGGQT